PATCGMPQLSRVIVTCWARVRQDASSGSAGVALQPQATNADSTAAARVMRSVRDVLGEGKELLGGEIVCFLEGHPCTTIRKLQILLRSFAFGEIGQVRRPGLHHARPQFAGADALGE